MTVLVLLWLAHMLRGPSTPPGNVPPGGTTPPGGSGPPPGTTPPPFPPPAPIPPPPNGPAPGGLHTLRDGETPFLLAKARTGDGNRWRELLPVNPDLEVRQTREPPLEQGGPPGKVIATHVVPWNAGQVVRLPAGWG